MVLARRVAAAVTTVAALVVATACSGTANSVGYAPVTGIIIRSDGLLREQGCGTREGQVASYAAVLRNKRSPEPTLGSAPVPIYPCFADATFSNLAAVEGSVDFELEVYAFNDAAARALSASVKAAEPADGACVCCASGACVREPDLRKLVADGSRGERVWRARCAATQLQDVVVLAVCSTLTRVE